MSQQKILIVEDDGATQRMYEILLNVMAGEQVVVLPAFSVEEAEEQFRDNPDIALIVMDACVPGSVPNTMPLARKLRAVFSGPMVATSSIQDFQQMLMQAGCDFWSNKERVPQKVLELLGLRPPEST